MFRIINRVCSKFPSISTLTILRLSLLLTSTPKLPSSTTTGFSEAGTNLFILALMALPKAFPLLESIKRLVSSNRVSKLFSSANKAKTCCCCCLASAKSASILPICWAWIFF